MSSGEPGAAKPQTPDLSLLKDMVGVQKALRALVARGVPVDREVVLGILEAQLEVYTSGGMFRSKEVALRGITTALQEDTIGVEAILQGAGIDAAGVKAGKGGFVTGFLNRIRPK